MHSRSRLSIWSSGDPHVGYVILLSPLSLNSLVCQMRITTILYEIIIRELINEKPLSQNECSINANYYHHGLTCN
jgi:hypothetical protein